MGRRAYEKPEVHKLARVVALLQSWAAWRGTVRQVMGLKRSPQCNLGPLVKIGRQGGEHWEHNLPEYREIFDDAVMGEVDRVIAAMDERLRNTLMLAYVNGRYLTAKQRAKRLKCTERMYYYRINEAYEIVEKSINWSKIERR